MIMTKNGAVLSEAEQAAVNQAHGIIAGRFTAAGETYNQQVHESVGYWLLGALYTTGIEGMMKCVTEAKIAKKRRASV